jgi:PEP-CTERM motif-containing protein
MGVMVNRAIFLALTLAALASPVRGQETLYVATGSKGADGVLYTVNPFTAAFTTVGPITTGAGAIGMTGLAFDPLNGALYGITGLESPNFPRSLVTINPATGAATVLGTLTSTFGTTGLTDISFQSDGTLFGISPSDLYTINLGTGALTSIGSTGLNPPGGGLAFNSSGILYSAGIATGSVDTLSTSTGARTVGPTMTGAPHAGSLGAMMALGFSSSNILYAANSAREQNGATITTVNLVTINPATGIVTDIGALPGNVDALAFGPTAVPEPSSIALLGLGAVIAGFLQRRRSR